MTLSLGSTPCRAWAMAGSGAAWPVYPLVLGPPLSGSSDPGVLLGAIGPPAKSLVQANQDETFLNVPVTHARQ